MNMQNRADACAALFYEFYCRYAVWEMPLLPGEMQAAGNTGLT